MAPSFGGQSVQNGYGQYGYGQNTYGQNGYGGQSDPGGAAAQAYQPQQQQRVQPAAVPVNGRNGNQGSIAATNGQVPAAAVRRQPAPRPSAMTSKPKPKPEPLAMQPPKPANSEPSALWQGRTIPLYTIARERQPQSLPQSVLGQKLW